MKARIIRIALASVVGLVIAAGIAWWQVQNARTTVGSGVQTGTAAIGGPFQLTDHTGKPVTEADYRGKALLIYFGYTYCPDVCPTELSAMAGALDKLGPAVADRIQPLFISVDPQRDTVAHLAQYVPLFHPRLVGLTGTPEQVRDAARAYRVYYAKASGSGDNPDYLMDHSGFIYLTGPDGRFLGVFPAGTTAEKLAEGIKARLDG